MQAPWLLMIETDYVWIRPLQAPAAQDPGARAMAFPFSYIAPQTPSIEGVMRKMYPADRGAIADVPGTGPAPVLMRFQEWVEVRVASNTRQRGRRAGCACTVHGWLMCNEAIKDSFPSYILGISTAFAPKHAHGLSNQALRLLTAHTGGVCGMRCVESPRLGGKQRGLHGTGGAGVGAADGAHRGGPGEQGEAGLGARDVRLQRGNSPGRRPPRHAALPGQPAARPAAG